MFTNKDFGNSMSSTYKNVVITEVKLARDIQNKNRIDLNLLKPCVTMKSDYQDMYQWKHKYSIVRRLWIFNFYRFSWIKYSYIDHFLIRIKDLYGFLGTQDPDLDRFISGPCMPKGSEHNFTMFFFLIKLVNMWRRGVWAILANLIRKKIVELWSDP